MDRSETTNEHQPGENDPTLANWQRLARRVLCLAIADSVKPVDNYCIYPFPEFRRLYALPNEDLQEVEVREFFHSMWCELYRDMADWHMDGRKMYYRIRYCLKTRGRIFRNLKPLTNPDAQLFHADGDYLKSA